MVVMVRRVAAGAVLVLASVFVVGCASNNTDLPSLGGTQLSGPKGVAQSPEQQATGGAMEAVTRYYVVLSRVLTGGDEAEFETVVGPDYLDPLKRELGALRAPGVTITGKVSVAGSPDPSRVVAPQDSDKNPIPGEAQVELRVCEDRTQLKVTGAPAQAVGPQTRLRRFQLINTAWPDPKTWKIARQYVPFQDTSCDSLY
ncbi:hypothetical protein AB0N05_37685 [Nocardia sp. NPDC051030]|uniref:hypothetical protein n=1 Tax=Nocardia sp. NPDC051030 TaxID=3155162 RepID=UPI003438BB37